MLRTLRTDLETFDLSITQYLVVRDVLESPGINQRILSGHINIAEAALVGVVSALERRKLLVRKRSANDRRNSQLFLTKEGRALARKILRRAVALNDTACVGFSQAEVDTLRHLLSRMKENLRGANDTNATAG
jgi:DNA-binding MarR family transcriptional regulator